MDPTTMGTILTGLVGAITTLFWLYVRELQRQLLKADDDKQELSGELKLVALKAEEAVKTQQELTRQELVEIRKTNAELVAAISGRGSVKGGTS